MSALPSNLVAREQGNSLRPRAIRRWGRNLEAKSPDGEKFDLRTANVTQLIKALQNSDIRQEAKDEINQRLAANKTNRDFFWLVFGWHVHDDEMVSRAYTNLRQLGRSYLSRNHRSLTKIRPKPNATPLAEWDDVIHRTLIGSDTLIGEIEKALPLSLEKLLSNALQNRYSGILTRMKQRHIDQMRKRRRERPLQRPVAQIEYGEDSESIVGFEKTGAVHDKLTYGENIVDPRFGSGGLSGTGDATEAIFLAPIMWIEWKEKNEPLIRAEAGEIGLRTCASIVEALASGSIDIEGMTPAETRKALVNWIVQTDGVTKRTATKRLDRLCKSNTLREYLLDAMRHSDRYQPSPPRLIKVGKSQRKQVGCDLFNVPDRRRIASHLGAE